MTSVKSNVNVKIDAEVKTLATQLLGRMGIDQTTAIEMFYRQVIKEMALPFRPAVAKALDEQLLSAIESRNIPHMDVEVNAEGHIVVDKEKDPELYDWAVNG